MKYQHIFSPLKIRDCTLENRIVMPSMGTLMASDHAFVTDQVIDYYVERAKGGVGLIITECASIWPESTQGYALGISDDKFIPGLKRLVDAVHAEGCKIVLQMYEAAECCMNGHADTSKLRIMSPIDKYGGMWKAIPTEELPLIAEAFGKATARADAAGFDGVEIHCGHTYLIHQFLSPHYNNRTDGYGTTKENCMKFPLMCLDQARKNLSPGKPLFIRISAHDDYTYDKDGNFDGLTLDDMVEFCCRARDLGVDVVDVSRGNYDKGGIYEVPAIGIPFGFNKDNALYIKEKTGLTVMTVGRLGRPELAEAVLKEGVDLVGWGHAHLADPQIVTKTREGREDEICYCIGCDQGCAEAYYHADWPHISCLRNPTVGREKEMALVPAQTPKTVLIAGAGVGGLEAARTLAQRGHKVILCEKNPSMGGQFRLAGVAPNKEDFAAAVDWMERMAAREPNVDIRVNTPVTPELLEELKPDHLIIATGGHTRPLTVPGGELAVTCTDILAGRKHPFGKCVVVGGGITGVEIAEYINARGLPVSVVEMAPQLGRGLSHGRAELLNVYLEEHPEVQVYTSSTVEKLEPGKVFIHVYQTKTNRRTKEVTVVRDEHLVLPADTIVASVGTVSNDFSDLTAAAERLGIPYDIIGDAKEPRVALDAIREAAELARTI